MLWVFADELLHTIPESGNSLHVLVERQHERVLLLLLGHELEWVVGNVTVELDAGLHTPVPLILEHDFVAEKEARLVSAHVPVADAVSIDDLAFVHVLAHLLRLFLINPFGKAPVLLVNLSISRSAGCQGGRDLLERFVKVVIVQEDPIVVVGVVEAVLDLADRSGDLPHIAVAGKCDKGGVHARAWRSVGEVRLHSAGSWVRRSVELVQPSSNSGLSA